MDSFPSSNRLIQPLTPREQDVLELLAQHLRYKDIANQLVMTVNSVKWYAQQIYGKLGVDNRRDAIQCAQERGLMRSQLNGQFFPEHLYQDVVPGPDQEFLPLSSRANHPNNLPVQLTTFIGRGGEIQEVSHMLDHHHLVTLTGTGGCGKTRLSLQVAASLLTRYADGAWMVELAPISDPKNVAQVAATTFGLLRDGDGSYQSILKNYLRDKQLLLVLDNCEQVLGACASLTDDLLHSCPKVTVLATSREALGINGEATFRIPSLGVPDTTNLPALEQFAQIEAVHLFVDRAMAILPSFRLAPDNLMAVARICQRLDGIPLAIELAASRIGVLSVEEIADRLDDRFRLLTGGSRTALPRQRTLLASIDWSYGMLTEKEQILFQRLSIFSGGFTLEAAENVCVDSRSNSLPDKLEENEILDGLSSLVGKSLAVVMHMPGMETRYAMLETIRQYAQEKLEGSGSGPAVREHHLEYFLSLARRYQPLLKTSQIAEILDRLDFHLDNLRTALAWALGENQEEGAKKALEILCSLDYFWATRSLYWEVFPLFHRALVLLPTPDLASMDLKAWGLYIFATLKNDFFLEAETVSLLNESIGYFRQTGNRKGLALALSLRCCLVFRHHRFFPPVPQLSIAAARQDGAESLALIKGMEGQADGDSNRGIAWVTCWTGYARQMEHQFEQAKTLSASGRDAFLQNGDRMGELLSQYMWTLAAFELGGQIDLLPGIEQAILLAKRLHLTRYQAYFMLTRAIIYRQLDAYPEMETSFLEMLDAVLLCGGTMEQIGTTRLIGVANLYLQKYDRAKQYLLLALALSETLARDKATFEVPRTLWALAGLAVHTGQVDCGVRLLGFVARQHEIHTHIIDFEKLDQRDFERFREKALQNISSEKFALNWQQGWEMNLEQSLEEARRIQVPA